MWQKYNLNFNWWTTNNYVTNSSQIQEQDIEATHTNPTEPTRKSSELGSWNVVASSRNINSNKELRDLWNGAWRTAKTQRQLFVLVSELMQLRLNKSKLPADDFLLTCWNTQKERKDGGIQCNSIIAITRKQVSWYCNRTKQETSKRNKQKRGK